MLGATSPSGMSIKYHSHGPQTQICTQLKSRLGCTKILEEGGAGITGAGNWLIDRLHGCMLLDAQGAGFVMFRDWETGEIVRHIDIDAQSVRICCVFVLTGYMQVYLPGTGSLIAIPSAPLTHNLKSTIPPIFV